MLCGKILGHFVLDEMCRKILGPSILVKNSALENRALPVKFSLNRFYFRAPCFSSPQKMEVLRQDVEEIEKEMEALRAYLAKTDEKRVEAENTIEDDMDYQDEGKCTLREIESRRWCFQLILFPYF